MRYSTPAAITAALAEESTKSPTNCGPNPHSTAVVAPPMTADITTAARRPFPTRPGFAAPMFCAVKEETALPTLSIGMIAMLSILVAAV